jgi:tetratricopeptide (TPR) repeat protein
MLVHRALGETLAASGQPEKAIEEYQAAIEKAPDDADLYEQLGEQQQKLARFDAAQATYDKELKLQPHSPIALYNLGKIDVEHGRPGEGVPLLREAQEAHALAAPTDFYLGYGLAQTGKLDEAAHWLEEAVHSKPSPFIAQSAYYQLARVYQRLNRKGDAERALNELKRLKAESAKGISGGEAESGPASPSAPDKTTH